MTDHLILETLDILFLSQSAGVSTAPRAIARELMARPEEVDRVFAHLARRGLLDEEGGRLTMSGLAAAAALHAHRLPACRAA